MGINICGCHNYQTTTTLNETNIVITIALLFFPIINSIVTI